MADAGQLQYEEGDDTSRKMDGSNRFLHETGTATLVEEDDTNMTLQDQSISIIGGDKHGIATGNATLVHGNCASVTLQNSTVNIIAGDQHVTSIGYVSGHQAERDLLDARRAAENSEKGFLEKTKLHLLKRMSAVQHLRSRPTTMIVEMERGKGNATDSKLGVLGRDVEKIHLEQIHEPINDRPSRHVMILGEAGAGKSTLSKMYALAVSEGKVFALRDIRLIHLVEAARLQSQTPSNVFKLFFTDQMVDDPCTLR